jgi:hypothetical protein
MQKAKLQPKFWFLWIDYQMTYDLYQTYRGLSQRSRRRPDSKKCKEAKTFAKQMCEENTSLEDRKKYAKIIKSLELSERISFGERALNALEESNWELNIPYQVLPRWREKKSDIGLIYIAKRIGCRKHRLKIGITKQAIKKRLSQYESRYGYCIECKWSMRVKQPFRLEQIVMDRLSHLRIDWN